MEINKNQVDAHMVNPPLIKNQIITHDTCDTDPSFLIAQMQNEKRLVMHILHASSETFEAECSPSSVIQPATKKKCEKENEKVV